MDKCPRFVKYYEFTGYYKSNIFIVEGLMAQLISHPSTMAISQVLWLFYTCPFIMIMVSNQLPLMAYGG